MPFLAVMTGWWWLQRSRLRRVARQEQAIADEQYRMMQPHAELNADALHELLPGEPGGYQALAVAGPAVPTVDGPKLTQTLV